MKRLLEYLLSHNLADIAISILFISLSIGLLIIAIKH